MNFEQISGFVEIKKKLVNAALLSRPPQCLLLYSNGFSVTSQLACAYSKLLLCHSPDTGQACDLCQSCLLFANGFHPDFLTIYPKCIDMCANVTTNFFLNFITTKETNSDTWRTLISSKSSQLTIKKEEIYSIIQWAKIHSFYNSYKVSYLWLPEFMNSAAYNALLKTIEEPPSKVCFVLVSHEKSNLPDTIVSRSQCLFVHSQLTLSNAGNAIKPITDEFFKQWVRLCYKKNFEGLLNFTQELCLQSSSNQIDFIKYSIKKFRLLYLYKHGASDLDPNNEADKFLMNINNYLTLEQIIKITEELNNACSLVDRNANMKIMFFLISCKFNFLPTPKTK